LLCLVRRWELRRALYKRLCCGHQGTGTKDRLESKEIEHRVQTQAIGHKEIEAAPHRAAFSFFACVKV